MTERMKAILYGRKDIPPKTSDEAAVKFAMDNNEGGSGEPVYVPFTLVTEGGLPTVTTTAVFADVKADYLSGKTLVAELDRGNDDYVCLPMLSAVNKNDPLGFVFAHTVEGRGSVSNPMPQYLIIAFTPAGVDWNAVNLVVET